MRHFINLMPHPSETLAALLERAEELRQARQIGALPNPLKGKIFALIFEKPSLRTRVSFEAAVTLLGGRSLFMAGSEVGLGVRESLADFARTMSRYVDGIILRVFKQETVLGIAEHGTVPVVNGLSDIAHPCQAMADLLTIRQQFGSIAGRTVVFVGDANNVSKSLAVGCGKLGAKFILARPDGYGFDATFLDRYDRKVGGVPPVEMIDPCEAVRTADVIYSDVFTSMGQEAEREIRLKRFAPYQVNSALLAQAPETAKVMHCLPAHRGEEITDEVLDGPASIVFDQAENRLHAQMAVLEWIAKG